MIPLLINLVLLQEHRTSQDLVPALWAALRETETFYNHDTERAVFHRFYISEHSPDDQTWNLLLNSRDRHGSRELAREQVFRKAPTSLWESAQGKFLGTYRASRVAQLVDSILTEQQADARLVVTDQELMPPPDWRYVIWSSRVVSTVPVDPRYWGVTDPDRTAIIKHRVRTACLSNVGTLVGLGRCGNPHCFLYRSVDSVRRLDGMVTLGSEHGAGFKALEGMGFEVLSSTPERVQPLVREPTQKRRFYER